MTGGALRFRWAQFPHKARPLSNLFENNIGRSPEKYTRVQLEDGKLQVVDLGPREETNPVASRTLLGRLTGLSIQFLLGAKMRPEYRQDAPILEIKITRKDGEALGLAFLPT